MAVIALAGLVGLTSCTTARLGQRTSVVGELKLALEVHQRNAKIVVEFILTNLGTDSVSLLSTDALWIPFDFVLEDEYRNLLPVTDTFKWTTPTQEVRQMKVISVAPGAQHSEMIDFHRWIRSDTLGESVANVPGRYVLVGYYRVPFMVRTGPNAFGVWPNTSDATRYWSGTIKTSPVTIEILDK